MITKLFALFFLLHFSSAFAQTKQIVDHFSFDPVDSNEETAPPILSTSATADGLKVFWWNIRDGGELGKDAFKKTGKNDLEDNLIELVSAAGAPEVLLLGEFEPNCLTPATNEKLLSIYPYFIYYGENPKREERGIAIFSKYPFVYQISMLDWSPLNASPEQQQAYKNAWKKRLDANADADYERRFADFRIKKGEQEWDVVPVHLMDNWIPLEKSDRFGEAQMALTLLYGEQNPHYQQVKRLVNEKLKPLLKDQANGKRKVILMGDFNLPDQQIGVVPVGYRLLSRQMTALVQREFTFPALSSDCSHFTQVDIDHAFYNQNLTAETEVRIPFSGSDHYPIEVQFSAK